LAGVHRRINGVELAAVDTSVWYGPPAEAIVEAARFRRADLIVMSSHGRSGVGRLVLGSVAETVLRASTVPILLLRPSNVPVAAALRAQGISVTWSVRRGRATEEILAAACESDVDLIAMATHGRTGLGRLLFGSVAEAVLRQAPVPVFMIRQPSEVTTAAAPSPVSPGRGGQPMERSAR